MGVDKECFLMFSSSFTYFDKRCLKYWSCNAMLTPPFSLM